ncbi:MAG TPA: hypothetical protein VLN74_07595 [Ilumatobacteraceae bacterium]|nr:hypothetical protein [Ilumatobacteraceae bacterium]
MSQRRFAVLVLAAVATLAACGSSDDSDTGAASADVDGEVVAVGPAPAPGDGVGSLGDAMEVAAAAPGQAADAACTLDRQTLAAAVEAYELLNGSLPASEQELLDAQMIREPSERFDVTADGALIPAPGSPCL